MQEEIRDTVKYLLDRLERYQGFIKDALYELSQSEIDKHRIKLSLEIPYEETKTILGWYAHLRK